MKRQNPWDLHPDRLGTTDETGNRIFVYTADVRGQFRRYRTVVQAVLIVFFLVLPWLKINGRQALLLNIPNRHFEIFGLSLRSHDAPLLLFLLLGTALGLALMTALFGRVWCGWACPQTVFIDGVFRRVERWIEGAALERMRNDRNLLQPKVLLRKILKWVAFTVIAVLVSHSFLAYFIGAERLLMMTQKPPAENLWDFVLVFMTSGVLLFNFGWFREQFCIILCPYGRFQSILMDEHSVNVAYDVKRGEPRGKPDSTSGDCVDCFRCVQVCPTRIDIRRGSQLECISCTACMDACNEVMAKTKRAPGLIRYASEAELRGGVSKTVRLRTVLNGFGLSLILALFILTLLRQDALQVTVLRSKGAPYELQEMTSGEKYILNQFNLEISNQSDQTPLLKVSLEGAAELVTAQNPITLKADEIRQIQIFIRFRSSLLKNGQGQVHLRLLNEKNQIIQQKEVVLVGPLS